APATGCRVGLRHHMVDLAFARRDVAAHTLGRRRLLELVALDIEHEKPVLAAGARPGGNELRERQRALVDRAPVHAVGENIFALRPQRLARAPERDDVIVDLLFARDLDQPNVAVAPVADRFDPQTRAVLITGLEILEVA